MNISRQEIEHPTVVAKQTGGIELNELILGTRRGVLHALYQERNRSIPPKAATDAAAGQATVSVFRNENIALLVEIRADQLGDRSLEQGLHVGRGSNRSFAEQRG